MLLLLTLLAAALLALNFPIFTVLLASSIVALFATSDVPSEIVVQTLFGSIDKFALMAIPFFIFAASVMDRGGMSKRLISWVESLFSSFKGGLGLTTVASCEVFGCISGSSPATVVAVGSLLFPALVKNGYGRPFSLGLVTASGAIAILIPPSIAMIIFATITNVSVGALFMGGIGAGLTFGACLAAYVLFHAYRMRLSSEGSFRWAVLLERTRAASWAIGMPVLILGGIYTGVFTPTEAAGVSAVYAIAVAMFVYREMTWSELIQIAVDSAVLTAEIMIIIAASGIFAWLLTVGQAQSALTQFFATHTLEPWVLLLVINIILLIAGMFIDPNSAQVILIPLLFPLSQAAGVDPVHLGIIVTLNLAIGMYTPPFGLNLFVSGGIFQATYRELVVAVMPFIAVSLVALGLITWIPAISLFVPKLVYGGAW
jgi:C4-dicarboxylate transporter, DctM subunit